MAVKVKIGFDGYGNAEYETHKEAARVAVEDGHLMVRTASTRAGSSGRVVAVYAPTRWIDAVVEGDSSDSD